MKKIFLFILLFFQLSFTPPPQTEPQEPKTSFVMDVLQPLGLPLVSAFHYVRQSTFINTKSTDPSSLETLGNFLLMPSHYLFDGKIAEINWEKKTCEMRPSFLYKKHCLIKSVLAFTALELSQQIGSTVKGISYVSNPKVREKQHIIDNFLKSEKIRSNLDYYSHLGIKNFHSNQLSPCLEYKRPSELSQKHQKEIKALKEICALLQQHHIIYWLDCGTCLGAYRYGGMIPWDNDIDLSILCKDHLNVKRILQKLDPERFQVQDWSNYAHPNTFLKIYLKETKSLVDIFHYKIDAKKKQLFYFFTYQESAIPKSWKKRELPMTKPLDFKIVFPLKRAYFDGLLLWVPNEIEAFLKSKYGENLEPSMFWDEKIQNYRKLENHPYWN